MKKFTLIISLCLVVSNFLFAQVAGDLDTKIQTINFNQQLSNVSLDPSPNVGAATRQTISDHFGNLAQPSSLASDVGAEVVRQLLEGIGISMPSEVYEIINGIGDLASVSINPTLNAGLTVDYGGYIELNDIGNADIVVDYPVEIKITYPSENTFGCGDEFTIQTSYVVKEKVDMLKVTPPFYEMEIGPYLDNLKFQVGAGISVSACMGLKVAGECVGYPFSWSSGSVYLINEPISLPSFLNPLPPLVNACENAFGVGKQESDLIACTTGASPILGLAQSILEAYNQSQTPPRDYGFASITANKITVASPDLPFGAPPMPEMSGTFNKVTNSNLAFSSFNNGKKLVVSGQNFEISKLDFDLISLLDFGGITTSLSLGGGLGSLDFGDLSPTFTVNQNMNFEFEPVVHLTINLGTPMSYEVHDDVLGVVGSGFGSTVHLIAGQKIVATYPAALSQPTSVEGFSTMDGKFKTLTSQEYFNSTQINLMQLSIGGSFNQSILETSTSKESTGSPMVVQDHQFNLTGFNSLNLEGFVLNPENPIIQIDDVTIEDIVNIGDGMRDVVYKIIVSNQGDVELRNSNVRFDLGNAFSGASDLEVRCTFSDDLIVNSAFDGINDLALLTDGNTLAVGQSSSIEILVRVKPEIAEISGSGCFEPVEYFISAFANGTSPIGTEVINNFYQCTGERTGEDIISVVDLGASIIESIRDYTIYGWNGVVIDKDLSKSWGNVGTTQSIRFENSSLKGGNNAVIVGDLHAGHEVFVQGESNIVVDYVQIANELKIPNKKSSAAFTGTISENSECVAVMEKISVDVPDRFGLKKRKINENEIRELEPGKYKEIRLLENSILKLSSGTYDIGHWVFLGDDAQVLFNTTDGPVVLNIDKWQALGRDNLSLRLENEGSVEDILYNYQGNQPCIFNNSFVQGQILAPNAEIEFALASTLEGSCFAEKVNFKTGSSFKGNSYLEEMNINPGCLGESMLKSGTPVDTSQKINSGTGLSETVFQTTESFDFNVETELKAYPNPTNSSITITSNKQMKMIRIHNFSGQEVMILQPNQENYKVNLENFSDGIYILNVQFENESKILKIVKN